MSDQGQSPQLPQEGQTSERYAESVFISIRCIPQSVRGMEGTTEFFISLIAKHAGLSRKEVGVICYGVTPKAHEGFVILELKSPVPHEFYVWLAHDRDVLDYLSYKLDQDSGEEVTQ